MGKVTSFRQVSGTRAWNWVCVTRDTTLWATERTTGSFSNPVSERSCQSQRDTRSLWWARRSHICTTTSQPCPISVPAPTPAGDRDLKVSGQHILPRPPATLLVTQARSWTMRHAPRAMHPWSVSSGELHPPLASAFLRWLSSRIMWDSGDERATYGAPAQYCSVEAFARVLYSGTLDTPPYASSELRQASNYLT